MYERRQTPGIGLVVAGLLCAATVLACRPEIPPRPNIVLIVFEDMSPRVGAFGDATAHTPNLDNFAANAIRYPNTFTTAGVCAPSRAALITGVYQQRLGAQHMRTRGSSGFPSGGPVEYDAVPPAHIKAFPELLRAAGYYTVNDGKTDYQFGRPFTIWDESHPDADYRNRRPGQPFFAFINLLKTHEAYIWPEQTDSTDALEQRAAARNRRDLADKINHVQPDDVNVPPYLPDTPVVRADLARHYNNIAFQEREVGRFMERLRKDDLLDSTVVMITGDHGDGFPRMKRTAYDSGTRVPLLVRLPGGRGRTDHSIVSFVDLSATILSLAGVEVPAHVDGIPFLGPVTQERDYAFSAVDRNDDLYDKLRSVRNERFRYIRNEMPDHALLRHLGFRDHLPTMKEIWRLHADGELNELQRSYVEAPRPVEELYDSHSDPHEVRNIAGDPEYLATLERLRAVLAEWQDHLGPYNDMSEAEMIARMWPGLQQPQTATPGLRIQDQGSQRMFHLTCDTPGASIGYRFANDAPDAWRLYTGPFAEPAGREHTRLSAKAIRYGYAESRVMSADL